MQSRGWLSLCCTASAPSGHRGAAAAPAVGGRGALCSLCAARGCNWCCPASPAAQAAALAAVLMEGNVNRENFHPLAALHLRKDLLVYLLPLVQVLF